MHDCRQTQDSLVDLVFDEADRETRPRLLAEVERCAACAAEYRAFAATLDACDEASAALAPRESYWPGYHAALTRRLLGAANDVQIGRVAPPSGVPFWKRLLTTSIRVPAPLAAAAALLLVVASGIALLLAARPVPEPVVVAAPPHVGQPEAAPQFKFIEVPVVQEKIVTQIIYLPRPGGNGGGGGAGRGVDARRFAARENLAGVRRQNTPAAAATPAPLANAAATPRPNFSGFKPAGEVNLRIIKGGGEREQ